MNDDTSGAVMGALNGDGSAKPVFDSEDDDVAGNVSPDCSFVL